MLKKRRRISHIAFINPRWRPSQTLVIICGQHSIYRYFKNPPQHVRTVTHKILSYAKTAPKRQPFPSSHNPHPAFVPLILSLFKSSHINPLAPTHLLSMKPKFDIVADLCLLMWAVNAYYCGNLEDDGLFAHRRFPAPALKTSRATTRLYRAISIAGLRHRRIKDSREY